MRKLAIFFPGVGYHCDKPLLYYTKNLACKYEFEIIEVNYGKLKVQDAKKNMEQAFYQALDATKEQLREVAFDSYDRVLFVSKSVGTAVSSSFQRNMNKVVGNIYFTPVTESFPLLCGEGIVFSGTADDWIHDGQELINTCKEKKFPLYIHEHADHSMETGNVMKDLEILESCIKECNTYIRQWLEKQ